MPNLTGAIQSGFQIGQAGGSRFSALNEMFKQKNAMLMQQIQLKQQTQAESQLQKQKDVAQMERTEVQELGKEARGKAMRETTLKAAEIGAQTKKTVMSAEQIQRRVNSAFKEGAYWRYDKETGKHEKVELKTEDDFKGFLFAMGQDLSDPETIERLKQIKLPPTKLQRLSDWWTGVLDAGAQLNIPTSEVFAEQTGGVPTMGRGAQPRQQEQTGGRWVIIVEGREPIYVNSEEKFNRLMTEAKKDKIKIVYSGREGQ